MQVITGNRCRPKSNDYHSTTQNADHDFIVRLSIVSRSSDYDGTNPSNLSTSCDCPDLNMNISHDQLNTRPLSRQIPRTREIRQARLIDNITLLLMLNKLRPRRNEQHFADDIRRRIFFNENVWISIKISLKFVPKGPINNIPTLVQIMAWRRSGDKPLSEPMMTWFTDANMRHSASMS